MKTIQLLILSLLLLNLHALDPCRKFICQDPADPANPEVCAKLEKKTHTDWIEYVGNCPKGKTCSLFHMGDTAIKCIDDFEIFTYPGQKASDPNFCHGKIEGGYCRGKKEDEACDYHFDCDIGLTCGDDKICHQAAEEDKYCHADFLLCKSYLYCMENHCVKYGSIANNMSPGELDSDLCKSHYIRKGICAEAPKLDGNIFVDTVEDICDYTNKEKEQAKCGYHKDGKAICRPGDGDLEGEWHELLSYLNKKPQCNSYLSHLSLCDYGEKAAGRQYFRAVIAHYRLHHYIDIQENLPCVQKYNHHEYFDYLRRYGGASSVSVFLGLLLTIVAFLV